MPFDRRALLGAFAAVTFAGSMAFAVPAADPANQVILTTKDGKVVIQLMPNLAPKAVAQMEKLTREGFYNGQKFHRVIDGFMAQTGDVKFGNMSKYDAQQAGMGGSEGCRISRPNFPTTPFVRGTVGMARTSSDPNSANSQFFIMLRRWPPSSTASTPLSGKVVLRHGIRRQDQEAAKAKAVQRRPIPDKIVSLKVAKPWVRSRRDGITKEPRDVRAAPSSIPFVVRGSSRVRRSSPRRHIMAEAGITLTLETTKGQVVIRASARKWRRCHVARIKEAGSAKKLL